jgi:hypothetical protein
LLGQDSPSHSRSFGVVGVRDGSAVVVGAVVKGSVDDEAIPGASVESKVSIAPESEGEVGVVLLETWRVGV